MTLDPVTADTNRYEWDLNRSDARETAIDALESQFWADHGERLSLLEEVGMSERDKLIAALTDSDYRKFSLLIESAAREACESEFDDRIETQRYNAAADKHDERSIAA